MRLILKILKQFVRIIKAILSGDFTKLVQEYREGSFQTLRKIRTIDGIWV